MKIKSLKSLYGPNIYHYRPVILMRVDLEDQTDLASCDIPGFNSTLVSLLPGLAKHSCSFKEAGGFLKRLEKGTYPAHIIEHIALELSTLSGIEVKFGKTRYAGAYGLYDIAVCFKNEEGMRECLTSAFEVFQNLLNSSSIDLQPYLQRIKTAVEDTKLGVSTQSIVDAAQRRNIPMQQIGRGSLFQLGYGKHRKLIQAAVTSETNLIGADIAQDKFLTKEILEQAFIPIPQGFVASSYEAAQDKIKTLRPPYVVKPLDGHHGQGVSLNLVNPLEIEHAFMVAQKYCSDVLIEEMIIGEDYRLLVIDGKFKAAAHRIPAFVTGTGKQSIQELIDMTNQDPLRGEGHSTFLSEIKIDDVLVQYLAKQNLDLNSIPDFGKKIQLRGNANLSTGGIAEDVTHRAHPDLIALAERISRVVNLNICGIDIICQDISKSPTENFAVIEVNAGPGLRMHMQPRDVHDIGESIIESLYPSGAPSRIPIISVTGTNGKTTIVRLLKHILDQHPQSTNGMTTTEGVWIKDQLIYKGDCAGPQSTQLLLKDPAVDCAVLEVARGGILKGGLGYDWSDVSIISNITADHIGQDGIEDLDDLLWVKSLVAERVKPHGHLILNADDPLSLSLKHKPEVNKFPRKIILYANHLSKEIERHLIRGGTAVWHHQGWIVRGQEKEIYPIMPIRDIPLTYGGSLKFNISNALAACAGAVALQVPVIQIVDGLKSFHPAVQNPGRMNIYKVRDAHVIIDYGHNEDALHQVGQFVQQFGFAKKRICIGLPGDRSTDLIQETGRAVPRYFDKIYLRDEADRRGRAPMEIPSLMAAQMPPQTDHSLFATEAEAVSTALAELQANDVLVVLYEQVAGIYSILKEYDPQPVSKIHVLSPILTPVESPQPEVR